MGTKNLHKEREKEIAKLLPSLQGISAMLLMTVLYAARVARDDLFKLLGEENDEMGLKVRQTITSVNELHQRDV